MEIKTRLLVICLAMCATLARAEIVEDPNFSGPKTTIRYSIWGGADEVTAARTYCTEFVQAHPEIRLDVSVYPWGQYWAKLQTQMASGLAPDVMEFYSGSFGVWAARGALMPLDHLAQADNYSFTDFFPQALANCRWNNNCFNCCFILLSKNIWINHPNFPTSSWYNNGFGSSICI